MPDYLLTQTIDAHRAILKDLLKSRHRSRQGISDRILIIRFYEKKKIDISSPF